MSTYILVHGAWHGGWAWTRVAPVLEAAGHRVLVPTLSGVGERAAELTPDIGLRAHADEIAALLEQQQAPAVVVGHSYGALVVREAVDRQPGAAEHVVVVDGWAGGDGTSMFKLAPDWFVTAMRQSAADGGGGWRIAAPPAALFGVTDERDAGWVEERLTPQPLKSFEEETRLSGAVERVPGTAILCTPGNGMPFEQFAKAIGYDAVTIESGHDAMLIRPQEVAELLLEVA